MFFLISPFNKWAEKLLILLIALWYYNVHKLRYDRHVLFVVWLCLHHPSTKILFHFSPRSVGNSSSVSEGESSNSTNNTVSFDKDTESTSSPSSFTWVGQTSRRFQLDPNGTSMLKFNALVSLPGVYNMNNLRVLARISDEHEPGGVLIHQKPCPPSFTVVENIFSNSKDKSWLRKLVFEIQYYFRKNSVYPEWPEFSGQCVEVEKCNRVTVNSL